MNHASLFSGIGGFDLAAEWMGWNNVLSCEIDPFCNKVLAYHFPDAVHIGDIKQAKFKRDDRGNVYLRRTNTNSEGSGQLRKEESKDNGEDCERGRGCNTNDIRENRDEEETWQNLGTIDIISGGFPCQPFSLAGKRRGSEDDRHLWPEMLRAIREIQPRWIVGENVFGLTNWNGGVVFREVLSDLENEGYEVQPFIIPACAVNAPHRRDRVWIVAHNNSIGQERDADKIGSRGDSNDRMRDISVQTAQGRDDNRGVSEGSCQNGTPADTVSESNILQSNGRINGKTVKFKGAKTGQFNGENSNGDITHSIETGLERENDTGSKERIKWEYLRGNTTRYILPTWANFPTQSPLRGRNDGLPGGLDGITVSKLRNESIKCYGNAIVPQVAYQIFKAIQQYEPPR